jgi:hypothetical protein
VTQGEVPWARPGSGFTVLMDALVLTQANKRPVSAIAQLFGVSENRLWRAINAPTEAARAAFSHAEVAALGVDEQYVGRRFGSAACHRSYSGAKGWHVHRLQGGFRYPPRSAGSDSMPLDGSVQGVPGGGAQGVSSG